MKNDRLTLTLFGMAVFFLSASVSATYTLPATIVYVGGNLTTQQWMVHLSALGSPTTQGISAAAFSIYYNGQLTNTSAIFPGNTATYSVSGQQLTIYVSQTFAGKYAYQQWANITLSTSGNFTTSVSTTIPITTETITASTTIPPSSSFITASDSSDPYLRYWELFNSYPGGYYSYGMYTNATAYYKTTETSGGTMPLTFPQPTGTYYFAITQSGGSSYGTYSGALRISGQVYTFSALDVHHLLEIDLVNGTVISTEVIYVGSGKIATTSTTTITTTTIPVTIPPCYVTGLSQVSATVNGQNNVGCTVTSSSTCSITGLANVSASVTGLNNVGCNVVSTYYYSPSSCTVTGLSQVGASINGLNSLTCTVNSPSSCTVNGVSGISASVTGLSNVGCTTTGSQTTTSTTTTRSTTTTVPYSYASYTLRLKKGWNLFSVPLTSAYLKNTTCAPEDTNNPIWELVDGSYVSTTHIVGGLGYWIESSDECSETFYGHSLSISQLPKLTAGWNMIGALNYSVRFSDISGGCTLTSGPWEYNTAAEKYQQSDSLTTGEGFFVNVLSACSLAIGGSPPAPPS